MRRTTGVAALLLAIGLGGWWAHGYRERLKMAYEYQHAEAAAELLEQLRGVPVGSDEDLRRSMSLSDSAEMELLNLDLQSPVARALNSYDSAIVDQRSAKMDLELANLKIKEGELEGKGSASMRDLRSKRDNSEARVEAIALIVDTCHDDVAHFLYGTASTNTCEASVSRYKAMYPDK
jgi:hypothetical protein